MEPALRVEHLCKWYRLGPPRQRFARTLSETLQGAVGTPWRWLRALGQRQPRGQQAGPAIVEALRDICLEVLPGEVVGVIGRNGAGKSTLLKILSRITEPSRGRVRLRGRVGSLLEVGTGFHPELTGRENVYLNGAILGMRRHEIRRKFDEIVAFAGVERFLDTAVKRYSSGMYMRLGFAVASHLEPEILLVDEVLAVGDASFQRKCVQKIRDVGRDGRTVLVVSHDLITVSRLCQRLILLEGGALVQDGPVAQVVAAYLGSEFGGTAAREWPETAQAPGNEVARLRAVRVRSENGHLSSTMDIRQPALIEMEYDVLQPGRVLVPSYHLANGEGVCICVVHDLDPAWRRRPRPAGRYVSTAHVPGNLLTEGAVVVSVTLSSHHPHEVHFHVPEAVAFQVVDSADGDSARGDFAGSMPGVVRPLLRWTTHFDAAGLGVGRAA